MDEWEYNLWDIHATALSARRLVAEGGAEASRFDMALYGPALTMSLRGLRVDERAAAEVLEETWDEARGLRKAMDRIKPFAWSRSAIKPSPHELKRVLFDELRAPVQLNRDGGRTTNAEALDKILNHAKSSEEAAEVARIALELSRLEEDRKVIEKPRGRDGRMHTGLGVATTVTSRWSSRRDAFGDGANLHALSRRVRRIFIADPGFVLVNRDLDQAESYCVAWLSGCAKYRHLHERGNVHLAVGQMIWPEVDGAAAKETAVPWNPDMKWYDLFKRRQHACLAPGHDVLTPAGWRAVDEIEDDVPIAVWSPSFALRWEVPRAWHRLAFDGELVALQGPNTAQVVTPEHRLPLLNNGDCLTERVAAALPLSYGRLPVAGVLDAGSGPGPHEARLVAATWADGNVREHWTVFGLQKTRKQQRIRALLEAAGRGWRVWSDPRPGRENIATQGQLRKRLGWDMLGWSLEDRLAFLEELPHWDGSSDRGWRRVFNTDRCGMEVIQALAHISGFRARITKHGNPIETGVQCWVLYISNARKTDYSTIKSTRVAHHGTVYCPTVSTGWFLVRKDGIVSVTGNSNYGQTPHGFARIAHLPLAIAKRSHGAYFGEFPEIKAWHAEVRYQLQTFKKLTTPMGRIRQFVGRTWDDSTLKEAIAHVPQSTISDVNKIILARLWRELDPHLYQCLLEVHDSNLGQVREEDVAEYLERSAPLARVEVPIGDGVMVIGSSVEVGRNWGKGGKDNPGGLVDAKTWLERAVPMTPPPPPPIEVRGRLVAGRGGR